MGVLPEQIIKKSSRTRETIALHRALYTECKYAVDIIQVELDLDVPASSHKNLATHFDLIESVPEQTD